MEYTQTRLRGAKDNFKKGGHVTQTLRDHNFRLLFDNRIRIVEVRNFKGFDGSNKLFDSKALTTKSDCISMIF